MTTIDTLNIHNPNSAIFTKDDNFIICSSDNCIYKINVNTHVKVIIAGSYTRKGYNDGLSIDALFYGLNGLVFSLNCKTLFVCDSFNIVIRAIDVKTGDVSTFVKPDIDIGGISTLKCPRYLKLSPDGNYLYFSDWDIIKQVCLKTKQINTLIVCQDYCKDFALFPDGKHMLICSPLGLIKIRISDSKMQTIGEGALSIVFSKDKTLVFIIEDNFNNLIILNIATNQIIHEHQLEFKPWRLLLSPCGRKLYITDWYESKINILDVSKYCNNHIQQFVQCQLFHYSFLNACVINNFSI